MAYFRIKANNSSGKVTEFTREAKDRADLYHILKAEGVEPIYIVEVRKKSLSLMSMSLFNRVPTHEKIVFARNLGSMIEAGLTVSRALSVLEQQSANKKMREICATLQTDISQGKTLAQSMEKFKDIFSSLFISMVHAGEESGNLSNSLKAIALQMDRTYTLQKKIKGAMIYPSVIMFAMVVIAILLLTYVVPTLTKTFLELNIKLPASTQFIINISDLIRNHGIIVLIVLIALALLFMKWFKGSGKPLWHRLITRLPLFGELVREVNSARTARTLSSLLSSGVNVVESVNITIDVLQNVHYKNVLISVNEHIKKGEPISTVFLEAKKLYPVFVGEMVAVGEETGKLPEMLLGVANFYEDDVDQRTKDMSTIIEPILMIIIGSAVGFFALSMISPMYSLVNVI